MKNMTRLDHIFSDRITDVPRSFIREILKVALDPTVISFAGGLPNRALFPVEALKQATCKVFETQGRDVLQYAGSEGHAGLREYISARYKEKANLDVPVDSILITSGSQQGLDLLGKHSSFLALQTQVLARPGFPRGNGSWEIARGHIPQPAKTDVCRAELPEPIGHFLRRAEQTGSIEDA